MIPIGRAGSAGPGSRGRPCGPCAGGGGGLDSLRRSTRAVGAPVRLSALAPELDAVPGTVSIWYGPAGSGRPWYVRQEQVRHYAASTMKVAVLAAAHRAHEAGTLDLDAPVPVTDRFASAAPGAPEYRLPHVPEDDPAVWARLGRTAPLRWLAERLIA